MKFYNLDKVIDNTGVSNKYLLTSIVAHWAREISDTKGRDALPPGAEEKFISLSLADLEAGKVSVNLKGMKLSGGAGEEELYRDMMNQSQLPEEQYHPKGDDQSVIVEEEP